MEEDDKSRVYSIDIAQSPYLSQSSKKSLKVVGEDLPQNSAFCIDLETKTHAVKSFESILEDGWRVTKLKL